MSQENYDNDLAVVNGHSYKELKSDNTNLAILCSHNFNQPFNQPIAYAQKGRRIDRICWEPDTFWCSGTEIFWMASAPGPRSFPSLT